MRVFVEDYATKNHLSFEGTGRTLLVFGALIIIILTIAILLTWVAFIMFPTSPEAQKVITVFAGIFGVITGSIGLYKFFK